MLFMSPGHSLGFAGPSTTSRLLLTVASRVYHGMKARRNAVLSTPNEPEGPPREEGRTIFGLGAQKVDPTNLVHAS